MKTSVKLEGFKELEDNLYRLKYGTAKSNTRRAMKESLEPTARMMRAKAPVYSGTLKESIAISSLQKSGRQREFTKQSGSGLTMYIGPSREGALQGQMQEFGTYKEPAQPFARPAWESDKMNVLDRFSVFLWDNVVKALGRQARKLARAAKK
ncbi:hypothetical protein D6851_02575 [Altericroceibacterium spongiae]|uniref:HK97 gp10 family phage protein n=1 Tax=Altericroceibacterium spongiae TaxID=2320269 RepID=A0A420ERQ7_9SPHN|nr:HK97-gp10 family putative phage morphogenesis protein [Altericroceibacterium spongiae]RKF23375.1 hypothetical protein D6851_02575 [Altericroceibacterium spongiae]